MIGLFLAIGGAMKLSFKDKVKRNLILVESSVRVDMVAMPKLTIKELRNVKPIDLGGEEASRPKEKKVEPSLNPSEKTFNKKSKKPLSFMERMKLLSQKKAQKSKVGKKTKKSSKTRDTRVQNELKKLVLEGNKISRGSSVIGSGSSSSNDIFIQYLQQLPEHIKPFWKLPSYLIDKNLKCRIRIFLAESGRLLKAEIYESSGVDEYDDKARDAVKKSSPFPRLSKEFSIKGTNGEIVLGFPL